MIIFGLLKKCDKSRLNLAYTVGLFIVVSGLFLLRSRNEKNPDLILLTVALFIAV